MNKKKSTKKKSQKGKLTLKQALRIAKKLEKKPFKVRLKDLKKASKRD